MTTTTSAESLREEVRRRYALAAVAADAGGCGCASDGGRRGNAPATATTERSAARSTRCKQRSDLPSAATLASLGCGNPTAVAELRAGETVLDLGSGGGIDVLLSARRVGENGLAFGLDMTDEMLALARRNAQDAGVRNAIFLKGVIEEIPLPAIRRRGDLELRDQPLDRQASGSDRNRTRAQAGRSDRDQRRGRRVPASPSRNARSGGATWAASRERSPRPSTRRVSRRRASRDVSVEFTHSVADGMHGAIVKGVKSS